MWRLFRRIVGFTILGLIAILIILIIIAYPKYNSEMKSAKERLLSGSEVVLTDPGPVEYATFGNGPPVLMVHGMGGGYDQGLLFAKLYGDNLRWICPSRFGYLRTPLPEDASTAAQADMFAALLDHLNIPEVAVVGFSAGGLSALQFALRHPDRCSVLIMQSAMSRTSPSRSKVKDFAYRTIFQHDFLYWSMSKIFKESMLNMIGVNERLMGAVTPEERQWVFDILDSMQPGRLRYKGIYNDQKNVVSQEQYPLGNIRVPTLVIHAVDDRLVSYEKHGKYTAQNIPGARMLELQSGGHFLLGQSEEVEKGIIKFLAETLIGFP